MPGLSIAGLSIADLSTLLTKSGLPTPHRRPTGPGPGSRPHSHHHSHSHNHHHHRLPMSCDWTAACFSHSSALQAKHRPCRPGTPSTCASELQCACHDQWACLDQWACCRPFLCSCSCLCPCLCLSRQFPSRLTKVTESTPKSACTLCEC